MYLCAHLCWWVYPTDAWASRACHVVLVVRHFQGTQLNEMCRASLSDSWLDICSCCPWRAHSFPHSIKMARFNVFALRLRQHQLTNLSSSCESPSASASPSSASSCFASINSTLCVCMCGWDSCRGLCCGCCWWWWLCLFLLTFAGWGWTRGCATARPSAFRSCVRLMVTFWASLFYRLLRPIAPIYGLSNSPTQQKPRQRRRQNENNKTDTNPNRTEQNGTERSKQNLKLTWLVWNLPERATDGRCAYLLPLTLLLLRRWGEIRRFCLCFDF